MSRRIIYRIPNRPEYLITEEEWDEVRRLQHWYNSEFSWTSGKLAFRRYVIFPNGEEFEGLDTTVWALISERKQKLKEEGMMEEEIIRQLERDRLISVKWGGYYDDCLASGFTRVADNEWNAFLVCDFLLKASTLVPHVEIDIVDEGRFVRTKRLRLRDGVAILERRIAEGSDVIAELIKQKRFFAVVDPRKYDKHPTFRNSIANFNDLKVEERLALVRNWNWLGYGNRYETDTEGVDLNRKLRGFDFC